MESIGLRILAGVARHAVEIEMYAGWDGATAWRMETPDSRLFVVLSPAPARGFSGEGQALAALTAGSTVRPGFARCCGGRTVSTQRRSPPTWAHPSAEITAALPN